MVNGPGPGPGPRSAVFERYEADMFIGHRRINYSVFRVVVRYNWLSLASNNNASGARRVD